MANMTSLERRERLFDLYAKNLALFTKGESAGRFACPICEEMFGPESVRGENPAVNLAHVYPQATGAKLETLTCERCNNRIGRNYDHHLATEHRVNDAIRDGEPIPGRLVVGDSNAGAEAFKSGNGLWFRIVEAQTDPAHANAMYSEMTRGTGFEFKFTYRYCDPVRQQFALLHAGYLALFHDFGYEYIFRANTQGIRDVLNLDPPPTEEPVFITFHVPAAWAKGTSLDGDVAMFKTGVAEIGGLRSLIAIFPAAAPRHLARCVLLPGLGDEGASAYREMLARPQGDPHEAKTRLCVFKAFPRLTVLGGMSYLHRLWTHEM